LNQTNLSSKIKELIWKERDDLGFNIFRTQHLNSRLTFIEPEVVYMSEGEYSVTTTPLPTYSVERKDIRVPIQFQSYPENTEEISSYEDLLANEITELYIQKEQEILIQNLKVHSSKINNETLNMIVFSEIVGKTDSFPPKLFISRFKNIMSIYEVIMQYPEYRKGNFKKRVIGLENNELLFFKPKDIQILFSEPEIYIGNEILEISSSFIVRETSRKLSEIVLFSLTED